MCHHMYFRVTDVTLYVVRQAISVLMKKYTRVLNLNSAVFLVTLCGSSISYLLKDPPEGCPFFSLIHETSQAVARSLNLLSVKRLLGW